MNQDCYATNYGDFSQNAGSQLLINTKSTDPFMGFPCYVSDATTAYLNQKSVMDAIHIPSSLNISWSECSGIVQGNYTVQYWDSKTIFTNILSTNYPLKVLVMNGDLDGVCSFLADEWFIEDFANSSHLGLSANRTPWIYQQAPGLLTNVAGFVKKFKSTTGIFEIDLITVKGAGHLVPQDRPGPALNVLANFLSSERNYSSFVNISLTPKPLLNPSNIYTIKEKIVHRGRIEPISFDDLKPDQVSNLPGLTYKINFNQYSGYLNGSIHGNYLHYWLVESQSNPKSDPLVLWLMGGPGCTSVGSLLYENGPFWPNPDGQTLFENVYSWNKVANMLYLEAPRGVGFSYQNFTENNDTSYNDEETAADNLAALIQFFSIHNEYQGRDFYIAGLSYGGVYVPTLSRLLIQTLQNDSSLKINFKGFLIGNGFESVRRFDSLTKHGYNYFHGRIGKEEWESIRACCDPPGEIFCNISKYVNEDGSPKDNSTCALLVTQDWHTEFGYDDFNLYQDCYNYTVPNLLFHFIENFSHLSTQQISNFGLLMNYGSTDSNGGFQCLSYHASELYLNRTDVRQSLHIPDFVQPWTVCKNDIDYHGAYSRMSHSLTPVYLDIIQSTYAQTKGLKILLYNGDADTPDDLMIAEVFVEDLVKISNNATTTLNRTQWFYTINNWTSFVTTGFVKSLNFYGMASLDLLTIKGAGHFADTDRPGPSLQVLYNFLKSSNYSTPVPEPQSSPDTSSTTPSTLASTSNLVVLVLIPYLTHILRWF